MLLTSLRGLRAALLLVAAGLGLASSAKAVPTLDLIAAQSPSSWYGFLIWTVNDTDGGNPTITIAIDGIDWPGGGALLGTQHTAGTWIDPIWEQGDPFSAGTHTFTAYWTGPSSTLKEVSGQYEWAIPSGPRPTEPDSPFPKPVPDNASTVALLVAFVPLAVLRHIIISRLRLRRGLI